MTKLGQFEITCKLTIQNEHFWWIITDIIAYIHAHRRRAGARTVIEGIQTVIQIVAEKVEKIGARSVLFTLNLIRKRRQKNR